MGLRYGLRKRCEEIARGIRVPDPFDLETFGAQIGERRGRPLHLMPFPLPPTAPCGLCVSTDTADYVIISDALPPGPARDQAGLHELAHHLLDHDTNLLLDEPDALEWLLPHLRPAMVRRMLARRRFNTREEREAETLGSLLRQRAGLWQPPAAPPATDPLVARLGRSLEHGTLDG